MSGPPGARVPDPAATAHLAARYGDGSYLDQVPDWHQGDAVWKAAAVSRMIERHGLAPKTVADVGCGAGAILRELHARMSADVRFEGYDISADAIALCREHGGERLRYVQADFAADPCAHAELVLSLDVFEHVPDYLGFLAELRQRGEWFIFHIPIDVSVQGLWRDSAWLLQMRRQYGHLHYFTRATALATLRDLGYEIADCFYTDDQQTWTRSGLSLKRRLLYELRRWLARRQPDRAAQLFEGFSVMVLARAKESPRRADL